MTAHVVSFALHVEIPTVAGDVPELLALLPQLVEAACAGVENELHARWAVDADASRVDAAVQPW